MATQELTSGDVIEVYGMKYTLLYPEMGVWMVCETDNPNASPVLKSISPRSYATDFIDGED